MGTKLHEVEEADLLPQKYNMRTSVIRMGQKFGQLSTVRGVTKYQISPFEQKVFGGFFVKSTVNFFGCLEEISFTLDHQLCWDICPILGLKLSTTGYKGKCLESSTMKSKMSLLF